MMDERYTQAAGTLRTVAKRCKRMAGTLELCRQIDDLQAVEMALAGVIEKQAAELHRTAKELQNSGVGPSKV